VSERKHRHVIELALAVMIHASIPMKFWDDIFTSVVYLINRQPPSSEASSPFFKLFHKTPDYSFSRVLDCLCFPYTRPYNDHKLQARSNPCVFLGYTISQKRYKCYHIESNKTFISRHVIFDEQHFPFQTDQHGTPQVASSSPEFSTWLGLLPVVSSQQQLHPTSIEDLTSPAKLSSSPLFTSGSTPPIADPSISPSRK
jgi:hypothetical protein